MSEGLAPVRPLMLTAVPAVLGVVGGILAVRFVGDGNGQVLKPPFLGALLPLVLLTRGLALGVDPWLGVRQKIGGPRIPRWSRCSPPSPRARDLRGRCILCDSRPCDLALG